MIHKESKSTKKLVKELSKEKVPIKVKRAKEIAAKAEGSRSGKTLSTGLIKKIEKNEFKSGHTIKKSSIAKTKRSKADSKYK